MYDSQKIPRTMKKIVYVTIKFSFLFINSKYFEPQIPSTNQIMFHKPSFKMNLHWLNCYLSA